MDKWIKLLVIMILILPVGYSVGVSPIRRIIQYEPGAVVNSSITISSDSKVDTKVLVFAKGSLEDYIDVKDPVLLMSGGTKTARYSVTLPMESPPPGVHKTDLVVVESPADIEEGGSKAYAITSVASGVWLRVPYPGKYAEANMIIDSSDNVNFVIQVMNYGEEDIKKLHAKITIYGATYDSIGVVETEEVSLDAKGQIKLHATWEPTVKFGKYRAVAEVYYDDKTTVVEDVFTLGELYIDIEKVEIGDFTLGDIAAFDITLKSNWNEELKDVYGELQIFDNSSEYADIKTASIDLAPMGRGNIKAYWDTEGIKVGRYNIKIIIHYNEKVTERLIGAEVGIDSINTDLNPTGQLVLSKASYGNTIFNLIVIILVGLNIWRLAVYIRKRVKKKDKKKK